VDEAINLAVADGLGSADLSHVGADLACRRGVELLARETPRERRDFESLYENLQGEVREKAGTLKTSPKELATTLQLLRIDGEGFWYGRLGDGGCVLVADEGVKWLGGFDRSLLGVSNLSDQKALSRLEWDAVPADGVNGFLIFSDGVEDIFLEEGKRKAHAENIHKMVRLVRDQNLEQLISLFNKFLSSDGGKDLRDDKTIIPPPLTHETKARRPREPASTAAMPGEQIATRSGSRSAPLYNIIGQTDAGSHKESVTPAYRPLLRRAILLGCVLAAIGLLTWFGIRAARQCFWLDPRPSCHQTSGPQPDWVFPF
jgi:hypothetical protein